jgi:hypothetical protein
MKLQDFNNKHKGETIFVLGNGEELGKLTKEQLDFLKTKTTIGVNYAHLIHTPTYMISGHFSQVLYAQNFASVDKIDSFFFQGKRDGIEDFKEDLNKTTLVDIKYFYNNTGMKVLREATESESYLVGAANISLSASNLAFLMGAKRVVYIGFNQKNRLHFYDLREDMKKTLRENIAKVQKKHAGKKRMGEINNDYRMFLEHMLPEEQLRKIIFFNPDVSPALRVLFKTMSGGGAEVISTESNSKLVDAGAKYMSFDDVMSLDNAKSKQ